MRNHSLAEAIKSIGTAFGTAWLVEPTLSADRAFLFPLSRSNPSSGDGEQALFINQIGTS
jgi:hypothetical protein